MQMQANTTQAIRITQLNREIAQLRAAIKSTNEYIDTNRHDRESVRDAHDDIATYESRLAALLAERDALENAQTVPWHRKITQTVPKRPPVRFSIKKLMKQPPRPSDYDAKMRDLLDLYRLLDDRLGVLDDNIFACTLNMDASQRTPDVTAQATSDIDRYTDEYEHVSNQLNQVASQIRSLRNSK